MGMGEEMLHDMQAAEYAYDLHVRSRLDAREWQTNDGRVLKISEMDDQHILNTLHYIKRNGFSYGHSYINLFETELLIRKDKSKILDATVVLKLNGTDIEMSIKELLNVIKNHG